MATVPSNQSQIILCVPCTIGQGLCWMLKKSLFPRTFSTQKPLILEKIIVRGCLSYGFRGKIHRMAILELFILELFRLKLYRRWNLIEWSYRRFDVNCEQVFRLADFRATSRLPFNIFCLPLLPLKKFCCYRYYNGDILGICYKRDVGSEGCSVCRFT